MNWCIDKTTRNERTTINNAMYGLFADLEQAETLLNTVIEDCFGAATQAPLSATEAEWAGTMIRIVLNILSDTIVAYFLTVADTDNMRVKNYIASAEAVKVAMQCESAHDTIFGQERELPAEKRSPIVEARIKIGDMEDAAAILALNGLVKNGGKNG